MRASGFLLLLSLIAYSFSQAGCGNAAQSKTTEESESETPIPIEAAIVETGSIEALFTGTASLEAEDHAAVVAKAGGIVAKIFAEEGDYVTAGAPLAQLDDERLSLEVMKADVTLQKLQNELNRSKELYDKQLVSTEEFERLRSEVELQQQARDLAALELEYTTVKAPISGVISRRLVKVGNMIQRNEVTFDITDFDPLLAIMHVPERELYRIKKNQQATLLVDALPDGRFSGFVKRISPVVDAQTGTFKVTIEVRDPSRRLMPGMFGRVLIVHDTHDETILIPKQAVVREDDQATVYVIRDSIAVRQDVVTGYENGSNIEILSGLMKDEVVVITGQNGLRDSSRVEVINL